MRLWLQQAREARDLEHVPIHTLARSNYEFDAKPRDAEMKVTIEGPRDVVRAFTPDNIRLYIDVNKLLPRELPQPEPVQYFLRGVPNTVNIRVTLEKQTVGVEVREPPK